MAPPGRIEEHVEKYSRPRPGGRSRRAAVPGAVAIPEFFQRKRLEEALRVSHSQLEDRVRQRTAELEAANASLQAEISERLRAERALREGEERYRELVENASDIIFSVNPQGMFTSCNQAGLKIMGYSREEALQLNWRNVVAPDHLARLDLMWAAKETRPVEPFEMAVLAKDGRRITLDMSMRIIYQEGRPVGVLGVGREITQRRQLEEQLRQAQKMEAVGRLAGGVAHDFNNLLMVVRGNCELLLDDLAPDSSQAALAREIQSGAGRATALTRQLLAFSRKQVLAPKLLDLNSVVAEMAKMITRLIGEDIELVTMLAPDLGAVQADPSQIEQVILNLAVNARDAMPRGGQLILETADVTLQGDLLTTAHEPVTVPPGPYVLLSVSDTGPGMDEATRNRIFEPFFTTKPLGQGTGLGLATVYGIVKQSGGYIWVYSEPGRGSIFKVYLPRAEGKAAPVQVEAPLLTLGGAETILLAEDEPALRQLARRVLESQGYTVVEAADGPSALVAAVQHPGLIDLLVTDVIMPGISGRELASQLHDVFPDMAVLYMSGYSNEAIAVDGILEPGATLMQKPFGGADLARSVRELLDKKK
jgi:PAS domain S-box-containing protein